MEERIRAFRYWGNGLKRKIEMGLSKIAERSRRKLFSRTPIMYHYRMKTAKCGFQIPTNNNENIGQTNK